MSNYHQYLTNLGYLLRIDKLEEGELEEVKRDLTFEPMILKAFKTMIKPSKFITYKISPNYIFVPRFYGIEKFGIPLKNAVPKGESMNTICQIIPGFSPRSHQIDAYLKTKKQLETVGGGILSVFCGWGKTFMAIYLAVKMHGKTLVLVHNEDLVQQWTDEINTFTGGTAKVGIIQQNRVEIDGCDFVLAMIPSLSKRDYSREIFSSFRLLIVDECHHVGSEIFSKALDKVCFQYTLGLSATPDRKDGLTQVFTNYLGPIFHVEKRKNRDDTLVVRLPLDSDSCYYSEQYFPNGTKNTGKMVLQLSEFEERNLLILHLLRLIYSEEFTPEPRQTLVLSKSRKHLTTFYQFLDTNPIYYQTKTDDTKRLVTFGYYWGRNPNGENGTTEYCPAAIPKLVQRRKQLQFDPIQKQKCIFTVKSGTYWCTYHQYLSNTDSYINGDRVRHGLESFELCQSRDCFNYFLPSNSSQKQCNICTGEYKLTEPVDLLKTLKDANIKKSSKQRHREMLGDTRKCDIILGTNDICSEAFSCSTLNTLICLTPQQEVEQTVGRILRKQDQDSVNRPLIIDLIDKCGNFQNHSRVRKKIYDNEGFRVVNLPSLNLDTDPIKNFKQQIFQHYVYEQSYKQSPSSDQLPTNPIIQMKTKVHKTKVHVEELEPNSEEDDEPKEPVCLI